MADRTSRIERLLAESDWTLRQILVPLDGSRLAETVLPPVRWFARVTGASVTLLHVLEHDAPAEVHGEPHLTEAADAGAYLAGLEAQLTAAGIAATHHVHTNPRHDVTRSIIEHVVELDADLIAMAAHGSGGLRGFLFGRVAQQVARRGATPVFLVQPPATQLPEDGYRCERIAVALNGKDEAERALPPVCILARAGGAVVHLVFAVPTARTMESEQAAAAQLVPVTARAMLELEQTEAVAYLQAVALALENAGVPTSAAVVRGEPALELATEANRSGADVLVMATHARGGISGLLAGSIGARIVGRFKGPLLLIPVTD